MPNQPGGAPYPLPSDPVAAGAAVITALAAFVDPAEVTAVRSASNNIPTATWILIVWSGAQDQKGSGLSVGNGSSGVTCTKAGRYRVDMAGSIPGGATGRRGVGIAISTATATQFQLVAPTPSGSNTLSYSSSITVPAGGMISGFMYQDSGATIVATGLSMTVNRQP